MNGNERAIVFGGPGQQRIGVLHEPAPDAPDHGVVIVVGGPQYRVASHRQFVLLARDLAAGGIPVLRFDHAGIGDSDGESGGFDGIDADVRTAVDTLIQQAPSVRRVCLVGLCDGASASVMYAPSDRRIDALVLLNPWVRTEGTLAQAYLDNYYWRRLKDPAFWRKMLASPLSVVRALAGYRDNVRASRDSAAPMAPTFVDRMLSGAREFRGRVLVILSGADTVAAEFDGLLRREAAWRKAYTRAGVSIVRLPAANHTFSRREWRDDVARHATAFLQRTA